MTYSLGFDPARVAKDLRRVEPVHDRLAVRLAVEKLLQDPFRRDLDVKRLTGRAGSRLRVGNWRVLFKVDTDRRVVTLTSVENRRDAYRR